MKPPESGFEPLSHARISSFGFTSKGISGASRLLLLWIFTDFFFPSSTHPPPAPPELFPHSAGCEVTPQSSRENMELCWKCWCAAQNQLCLGKGQGELTLPELRKLCKSWFRSCPVQFLHPKIKSMNAAISYKHNQSCCCVKDTQHVLILHCKAFKIVSLQVWMSNTEKPDYFRSNCVTPVTGSTKELPALGISGNHI